MAILDGKKAQFHLGITQKGITYLAYLCARLLCHVISL
jgi:hypothetical protein